MTKIILVFNIFNTEKSSSSNGGLTFFNQIWENIDIEIKNFGKVPLFGDGFQFRYGNFTFPQPDNRPTILSNTNLSNCFFNKEILMKI